MWLARLCENLIDNAVEHGDAGGAVRVELEQAKDRVIVRVANQGQVAEHVRKRLFRRFVTTRADRGGTGLGLAIARAVAEAHGGAVTCSSFGPPEVVFTLTLPVTS